jgi:putative transposase
MGPSTRELILAERGVLVTHESIRNWYKKFGAEFAKTAAPPPTAAWGHVAPR